MARCVPMWASDSCSKRPGASSPHIAGASRVGSYSAAEADDFPGRSALKFQFDGYPAPFGASGVYKHRGSAVRLFFGPAA